jgi:1-acyl-sn-glycerol-3-phosphate acyltransferase
MDRHSPGSTPLRHILATGYRAVARLEVEGHAHIPRTGGCLLVFNHLSNFDPHLIFSLMPRRDAAGLVAADYRRRPATRWLLERATALPRLRRVPVRVGFGTPFPLPALDCVPRRERLAAHTETIMHQIAALLPPAYRGVYAERGVARRHG